MAEESPVGSPLSILSSDDFEGEEEQERLLAELERKAAESLMPPAKRQKLGDSSKGLPPLDNDGDISSDTSGEIPSSPSNPRLDDDDAHGQVTVCAWMGCTARDLGDMDKLVAHIHEEHIETRTKKYTCEWSNCTRRSMNHTSGYALKAHVRSHTREKPFYCALPECDRAFTRSDALAKHMRTVHETEALRPSDPIPKSMHPAVKAARLKLAVKPSPNPVEGLPPLNGFTNGSDPPGWTSSYPTELGFTPQEEARGPQELFRLLRRQVHWAEEEGELLKRQCEAMEEIRRREWVEKEVLLHQVVNNEMDWHRRREEVLAGKGPSVDEIKAAAAALSPPATASSPPAMQPSSQPAGERDAAAVLASMHQI